MLEKIIKCLKMLENAQKKPWLLKNAGKCYKENSWKFENIVFQNARKNLGNLKIYENTRKIL